MSSNILEVHHLKQYFPVANKKIVKAVDDVSFNIANGETFGLVGESGSGKTTIGRSIIRLYQPTSGEVIFEDTQIAGKLAKQQLGKLRKDMQMIFQDPMSSLNPRKKVGDIIKLGLDIHYPELDKDQKMQRVVKMLKVVGLDSSFVNRYPQELSGGQRQRVGIARVVIMNPRLIIADEAISALDVSVQAQVVNLLQRIQRETGSAMLFIAHDLAMVKHISSHIGVIHLGHIVELGATEQIFANPIHPYTKSLLAAIPTTNPISEQTKKLPNYHAVRQQYENKSMVNVSSDHQVLDDGSWNN
ncbi:ATP-binding cassette domain-containing protein [Lactobacillus sp. ESL0731]|uniref:ATP-binding cassette domain-containing protein n=1 Tax=unclassified Lactobacillus TaxID=2620435 RepID=UPI0023F73503|nr:MULTISPECIES: ATP-binding cassette domain-containing protein [unclassified Lactobacillus]WEV51582.1 ATP-binding cassette domain-containing protein [Lactobacillus sp. ESL0700]WEV62711.1 ATP-binding cassette domain-containing protein [Lactobacillus sp. ESL0731]